MDRIVLAALLVLLSSTLAYAQVANAPTRTVGDSWTYSKRLPHFGEETRVVKVDENSHVIVRPKSACPACLWFHDKDMTVIQVLDENGKSAEASLSNFGRI